MFVRPVALLLLDAQSVQLPEGAYKLSGVGSNLVGIHILNGSAPYALHNHQTSQPEIESGSHTGRPELPKEAGFLAGIARQVRVKPLESQRPRQPYPRVSAPNHTIGSASSLSMWGLKACMAKKCIFCKIMRGEEKAWKIYEDNFCTAFLDAFPVTEGHVVVATNQHVADVFELSEKDFLHLFKVARTVSLAMKQKLGAEFTNIITAPGVIQHAFVHVVPRYDYDLMGPVPDMENKRGLSEHEMEGLSKKLKGGLHAKSKT